MGVLGDILGGAADILGLGGDTGAPIEAARLQSEAEKEAAALRAAAFERALPMLQEQLGLTRGQFDPFVKAGIGALPELQRGFQAPAGTTVGGLEEMIAQIMGGEAFGGLVEERQRGIQGQLAAGGLTRSGRAIEEAAAIPTDLALQLENLLTGRQFGAEQQRISGLESLAGGGRAAAGAGAGISSNILANIINAITGQAGVEAGGITRGAEATASGILGKAEAEAGGIQNLLNLGGTLGSAAIKFSDPRLKKNIKVIGKVGPLDLVEWEWHEEFDDTIVNQFPTMGYLSTQVKEHYPEHVYEFGGYDVIDYPSVNERLLCH